MRDHGQKRRRRVSLGIGMDGSIKPILCIALLAVAVYLGIQFGMPYYRYSAFRNEVREIARLEIGDVERTKTLVSEAAERLKVPVDKGAIKVSKKGNIVRIQASWSVNVDLLGYYQKRLDFKIDIEE